MLELKRSQAQSYEDHRKERKHLIVSNHRAHYQKNPQYNLVGIPHVSTNHEIPLNCCFFRTRAHGF